MFIFIQRFAICSVLFLIYGLRLFCLIKSFGLLFNSSFCFSYFWKFWTIFCTLNAKNNKHTAKYLTQNRPYRIHADFYWNSAWLFDFRYWSSVWIFQAIERHFIFHDRSFPNIEYGTFSCTQVGKTKLIYYLICWVLALDCTLESSRKSIFWWILISTAMKWINYLSIGVILFCGGCFIWC